MKTTFSTNPPVAAEVTRRTHESIHQPPPHVGGYTLALLAAAALFTHTAFAGKPPPPPPPPPPPSSGTVVLTYIHPGGMGGGYTVGYGITAAPSGNVYVSGWADVSNNYQWNGIVLGSGDAGASWWLLDDNGLPDFYREGGVITSDPAGNLYTAHIQYGGTGNDHWITRRSTDGGVTWATVDDFDEGVIFSGIDYVYGITADSIGNVYVGGESYSNQKRYWTIRKGVGGTSFSTVDTVAGGTVQAVFAHPITGAIFAAGYAPVVISGRTSTAWIVRRSTDGGSTWSTVETFQLQSGQTSHANAIGADASGNVYVVGDSGNHWLVRKSTNGGNSFSTIDDIPPTITKDYIYYSKAYGFAASSTGDLYVFGLFYGKNYLRKSAGGTGAWTMVDQMTFHPNAIAANGSGNVFVAGQAGSGLIVKKY